MAAGGGEAARVAGKSQNSATESQKIASKEAKQVATRVTAQAGAAGTGAAGKQRAREPEEKAAVAAAENFTALRLSITGSPDAAWFNMHKADLHVHVAAIANMHMQKGRRVD